MASKLFFLHCIYLVILSLHIHRVVSLKTYRVTTIEVEPFVFRKQGTFYGYIPDVLEQAGRMLNATFQISVTPDYNYGSFLDDGNWTGMIGDLVGNRSDIAAADLTITATRATAVHFSQSYFDLGLRILIKKPSRWQELEAFMVILSPLRAEMWIIGLVLFLAVSILLTIIGKFSPWEQLWIDGGTFDVTSTGMTLPNSLLYSFGSLLWQGSRGAPRSVSGRTLACFWWIFAMFFLIVYAANLTAFFLTKEPLQQSVPFATFDEMSRQSKVKFGFIPAGAVMVYFKWSKQAVDSRIYQAVMADTSVLVKSNWEGIKRVKDGNGAYAFIAENLHLEYAASRECDLVVVGELRAERSFGFACRKETTICRGLDVAILRMKEAMTLEDLHRKWFSGPCLNPAEQEAMWNGVPYVDKARQGVASLIEEKAVSLRRFGGPLILLLIGALLSLGILVVEVMWVKRYGEPQRPGVSDDERRIKDNMDLSL